MAEIQEIEPRVSRPEIWIRSLRSNALRDAAAGSIASVLLLANIISFGALMFPGELSAGMATAIWAMLIGSCLGGLIIALTTSLPPLATGIDSPTGAILVLLGAAISYEVLHRGGSPADAIQASMLFFTVATLVSGTVLYLLGTFRSAVYIRFVPYSVVAGFLAATGVFLILGGIRTAIGRSLTANPFNDWTSVEATKIVAAVAVLLVLLGSRRWVKSGLAMPVSLVTMWLVGAWLLHALSLSAPEFGWYLPAIASLDSWSIFSAWSAAHLSRSEILSALPELVAAVLVSIVSLVTKVASLELARQAPADLNQEFRTHGLGNIAAAAAGGIACNLQTGTSRLLEFAGGRTRASGAVSAVILGLVALTNFNLSGSIPIPVIAGLVFFLGYTFLVDALLRPFLQRAWLDLALAVLIALICVLYGYLVGVLAGTVCACVLFAVSYSRHGVVRRHATRASFASYVTRPVAVSKYLENAGGQLQIYWLSGHIFFGSAESLFERVRNDISRLRTGQVSFVVLDFEMVSGADTSAILSITKLRDLCSKQDIRLVFCSTSASVETSLRLSNCLENSEGPFPDVNLATTWCEEQMLVRADVKTRLSISDFESWLQSQLGPRISARELFAYLEIKSTTRSEVIYRQGDASDTMDIVAEGSLVVDVTDERGGTVRVRRINTHSIVGEMGFFRHLARSATVSSDGPVKLLTLTRSNFERMRIERPDLAYALDDFIISILADRVDTANRSVMAMRS